MAELLDSGTRREWETGAVRDCADGKTNAYSRAKKQGMTIEEYLHKRWTHKNKQEMIDRVRMPDGQEGFVFGRRASSSFDIRKLDGTKLSAGISYKKLKQLEKRKQY